MAHHKRFIFLSALFYAKYPASRFPELMQKRERPYVQVYTVVDGVQFAITLRSDIHHPHVLWTDKANRCGLDFSKAVVVSGEEDIDQEREPRIRQHEFDALRGKDYRIKKKMSQYLADYKQARANLENPRSAQLVKYSSLQYFEKEIGL